MLSRVLFAIFLLFAAQPVPAQNPFSPALTVNSGVITHYDVTQRMRLLEALGATGDLRALATEQLIEDRIKVQAAADLGLELPPGALEAGLDEFASSRGLTIDDVLRVLAARNIDRQALDDFIESGLIWREVVTSRFRARAMPSEADLDAALELASTTPQEVLQLAEIALPFAERGEAATIALAERLARDLSRGGNFTAAVREYSRSDTARRDGLLEPVPASQLPPAIRSQVLLLSPGQVTRPFPIGGGLAILKLVSINRQMPTEIDAEDQASAREQLREQLFVQRITGFGDGYLQELMRDALIVER
jgi:peptidyl-prolyl cis-trans isomerase SurA